MNQLTQWIFLFCLLFLSVACDKESENNNWVICPILPADSIAEEKSYLPYLNPEDDDTIRILALGNSFSFDAFYYLPSIVKERGKGLIAGNLIYSACSLERHWKGFTSADVKFDYVKDYNRTHSYETGWTSQAALQDEEWDIVCLQQVSSLSGIYGSMVPYAFALQDTVESRSDRQVDWGWHLTWAYEEGSNHSAFSNYHSSQDSMYNSILAASYRMASELDVRLIFPTGTAIQYLRAEVGDSVCRDTYHLNPLGRYTAACTWYEMLYGEAATEIGYQPSEITDAEAIKAREAAHKAVADPFGKKLAAGKE